MSSTEKPRSPGTFRVERVVRPRISRTSPKQGDEDQQGSRLARALRVLGPGLVTGASDDDPAGIFTYAVAGATLGFSILWTTLISFPLMMAMQLVSARIGLVRRRGIASVIKEAYGNKWLLYPATGMVLIANTFNIGADIGAIAQAIQLETGIPSLWLVVPITVAIVAGLTFGSYKLISTIFKWLTLPLLAYIVAAVLAGPSIPAIVHGTFIPHVTFDKRYISVFVAIMGTTITPYLWFWQANQEVEDQKEKNGNQHETAEKRNEQVKQSMWDVATGTTFSTVVMYAVIVATAATLHQTNTTHITSSAQVASALRPALGSLATLLFAIGIIGAGTLAVPILAGSASYAVGETFGWKVGIDEPWYRAKSFYAVIAAACLIGMLVNFVSLTSVTILFYSAIINGMIAPPLMVVLMLVTSNGEVMEGQINSLPVTILGWAATGLMAAGAIAMFWTL